ncbi:putative mannose-1-phosphate guanylyltransferase [Helianthus debilis subsp. tardiflorus]
MVRPKEVLEKTLLFVQDSQENYLYKCDQLKSIRQDLIVQQIRNELTVGVSSFEALQSESATRILPADFVRLDQDILSPFAGKKQLYTYEIMDFWEQIKIPGMSLKCSGLYHSLFRHTSTSSFEPRGWYKDATVIGDVYIHPSA